MQAAQDAGGAAHETINGYATLPSEIPMSFCGQRYVFSIGEREGLDEGEERGRTREGPVRGTGYASYGGGVAPRVSFDTGSTKSQRRVMESDRIALESALEGSQSAAFATGTLLCRKQASLARTALQEARMEVAAARNLSLRGRGGMQGVEAEEGQNMPRVANMLASKLDELNVTAVMSPAVDEMEDYEIDSWISQAVDASEKALAAKEKAEAEAAHAARMAKAREAAAREAKAKAEAEAKAAQELHRKQEALAKAQAEAKQAEAKNRAEAREAEAKHRAEAKSAAARALVEGHQTYVASCRKLAAEGDALSKAWKVKHTADAKTLRNIKFSSLSFQRQQVIGVSGTLCRRLQEARSHSDSEGALGYLRHYVAKQVLKKLAFIRLHQTTTFEKESKQLWPLAHAFLEFASRDQMTATKGCSALDVLQGAMFQEWEAGGTPAAVPTNEPPNGQMKSDIDYAEKAFNRTMAHVGFLVALSMSSCCRDILAPLGESSPPAHVFGDGAGWLWTYLARLANLTEDNAFVCCVLKIVVQYGSYGMVRRFPKQFPRLMRHFALGWLRRFKASPEGTATTVKTVLPFAESALSDEHGEGSWKLHCTRPCPFVLDHMPKTGGIAIV